MKTLIFIFLFEFISIFQSLAQRGPIVIFWHGRYIQDSKGWHCVNGAGRGCIGPRIYSKPPQNQSFTEELNNLRGIENGFLEYDALKEKWYIYISKDVQTNPEVKNKFKETNIQDNGTFVIDEDVLIAINSKMFNGKMLTVGKMDYVKDDLNLKLDKSKTTQKLGYLKLELKECTISSKEK